MERERTKISQKMQTIPHDYLVRKERGDNYLLFNYKNYNCFLINDLGYKILQHYPSSSITEIADLLELREQQVTQFIEILKNITTNDVRISKEKDTKSMVPSVYGDLRAPIRVSWLITLRCNLMCKHCYIGSRPVSEFRELPFTQVKAMLQELANAGVFIVYFTGGEPFVRSDFLEILKVASDMGLKIGISTNGLLLNENVIKKLSNLNVIKIQVSLDGATKYTHEFVRGPDTFERTVTTIRELVKSGLSVGITFVCHRVNMHEMEEVFKLAFELKVKGIKISPLMSWGRARELLHEYIPSFEERVEIIKRAILISKKLGISLLDELHTLKEQRQPYIDLGILESHECSGCPLIMGLTLLPDGEVIPCEVFADRLTSDIILGNLANQDTSIEEIWDSAKARAFREAASLTSKTLCANCPYLRFCGSYCLAEIYIDHGKFKPPSKYFEQCRTTWKKLLEVGYL